MTAIPDCRHDKYYNEDFLNADDKEFLAGFDYCLDQITNLFRNNLEAYKDKIDEMTEDKDKTGFADVFKLLTASADVLAAIAEHWAEKERNELITSIIDGMDDKDYANIREAALKKNPKKNYYDTRDFAEIAKRERRKEKVQKESKNV